MPAQQSPGRSFPHFGKFLLVACVLFVAVPTFAFWLRFHREEVAIAEIRRLGGRVQMESTPPTWLDRLFGNGQRHLFDRAVEVSLSKGVADDETLSYVGDLSQLESLWLENANISDAGLVHLASLSELRSLSFNDTPVTDVGLRSLHRMPHLRELWLYNTDVSKYGVEQLQRQLPRCKIHF